MNNFQLQEYQKWINIKSTSRYFSHIDCSYSNICLNQRKQNVKNNTYLPNDRNKIIREVQCFAKGYNTINQRRYPDIFTTQFLSNFLHIYNSVSFQLSCMLYQKHSTHLQISKLQTIFPQKSKPRDQLYHRRSGIRLESKRNMVLNRVEGYKELKQPNTDETRVR